MTKNNKPKFTESYKEENFKEDLGILGADLIRKNKDKKINLQQFSKLMVAKFGDVVKPYLKDAFKAAKAEQLTIPSYVVKEAVKRLEESIKFEEIVSKDLDGKDRSEALEINYQNNKDQIDRIELKIKQEGIDAEMISLISITSKLPKDFSIRNGTKEELTLFEAILSRVDFSASSSTKLKITKEWSRLNKLAHTLEYAYGLRDATTSRLKRMLGVPKGSLKYASETQLKKYTAWLKSIGEKLPQHENSLNQRAVEKLKENDPAFKRFIKGFKNAFVPAFIVPTKPILKKASLNNFPQVSSSPCLYISN